jgi:vacuolar-type H+-ATPase subunit C/Vma6
VLRARFNYDAAFDDIAPLASIRGGVQPDSLRSIASADDLAGAVAALPGAFKGADLAGVDAIDDLDRRLEALLYTRANAAFYGSGVTLGVAVAFYYLKRIELANLIRLAEGYRYELAPAEMRRRLVPPLE